MDVVRMQLVFKYLTLILRTLHTFGNKEEEISEEIQCDKNGRVDLIL